MTKSQNLKDRQNHTVNIWQYSCKKTHFTIITITICKHNHEYIIIAIITMYDQNSHIIDI